MRVFMSTTTHLMFSLLIVLLSFSFPVSSNAPTIMQVPPLQWINITGLVDGSIPPSLKGASLGYDSTYRHLLLFGGESQAGIPQSTTYLLNLDTLTWSSLPSSNTNPPARSYTISGSDMASSYRHGHVVIGGKGANGALSDAWEFDYISQFWANINISPGGPSPRWGASGGSDPRVVFLPSSLNITFYLAGGNDGQTAYPLSDVWRFNITGTLSSNVLNSINGSWDQIPFSPIQSKVDQAGATMYQSVVAVGGCNTTGVSGNACLQGDSYVINTANGGYIAPAPCPAPRFEPVLAPNMNQASSTFSSQVFLLLGTYNTSVWQDNNGLASGEVAVLDTATGSWSRILPTGDPNSTHPFPTPRSGASIIVASEAMIGSSRGLGSDILVYGGQDASGTVLSETWILRTYNGTLTSSGQQWSGFGNGQPQTGADANGNGVNVTFLTTCASLISGSTTSSSSSSAPTSSTAPSTSQVYSYNTSFVHKLLAPLSVAILLPAILLYRLSSSSDSSIQENRKMSLVYVSVLAGIAAYGLGIGGLAASFTSITLMPPPFLVKRSSTSYYVKTAHGKAGLAFFIALYGFIPALALSSVLLQCKQQRPLIVKENADGSTDNDEREKLGQSPAPSDTPHGHVRSPSGFPLWPGSRNRDARRSSDSVRESLGSSTGPSRSFEVTNRPSRSRHYSGDARSNRVPRNLSEMSWLERRRHMSSAGELDYALGQLNGGPSPATPNTAELLSTNALMGNSRVHDVQTKFPPLFDGILHVLFNVSLIGLCVVSLVELWNRASVAIFAVFLVWTVLFYVLLFILAWKGHPRESILAAALHRLSSEPEHHSHISSPSRPLSSVDADSPSPPDGRGPYVHHQPPFRTAASPDELATARHLDTEDEYDGEDEDIQQRRIEEEMSRRDVSIVTVPRRKLWITNLSNTDV